MNETFVTGFNIFLMLLLPIIIIGTIKGWQIIRARRFAEWIAEEGQFEPLPDNVLDGAIAEAKENDYYEKFSKYLQKIRREHGHNGLKTGHLYWIWHQIENDIDADDVQAVPSFIRTLDESTQNPSVT